MVVPASSSETSPTARDRARGLLRTSLVVDGMGSLLIKPEPAIVDGKSYPERALEVGLNAMLVTVAAHSDGFDDILGQIYEYLNLVDAKPDLVSIVETADDLVRTRESGQLGIILASQTGNVVGRNMARWTLLHRLGLRVCQLTYNERNELGDGCLEPEDRGLTSYGQQSIQEMNRLGITVDLSHVGVRTALDATSRSDRPVIYSHANVRALCDARRNLTTEQMSTMAQGGGVMGITAHSMMCYSEPGVQPTIERMLDMFDHAIQLIGVDHVAVGSDVFDSYTKLSWETTTKRWYPSGFVYETMRVRGFGSVDEFPNLAEGLCERGYSDEEISKLMGANWLRVFRDTWKETN